jgi:nitrogen regulatory protein P-II 1
MKMVIGVIRSNCLKNIVKELEKINIREMTISEVKGIGEQATIFNAYAIHNLILIIVPDEKVSEVEDIMLEHAREGIAGDGIVAVCPVDYMVKIKTKERLE